MKKRLESIYKLAGYQVSLKKKEPGKPVLTLSMVFGMNSVTTSLRILVLKQKLYLTICKDAFLVSSLTDNCQPSSARLNPGVPLKALHKRSSFLKCTTPANWPSQIIPT